ncbi:hypothetical protein SEA_BEUFFERT_258 [Streptomyces phage Beuffert]|nr:hypothetical protein SEA_BEUFFERT_258 [Streptomyces phage Beuffert]
MPALTYTVGRLRRKEFRATLIQFEKNGIIGESEEVKGFFESRFVIDATIDGHVQLIKSLGINLES